MTAGHRTVQIVENRLMAYDQLLDSLVDGPNFPGVRSHGAGSVSDDLEVGFKTPMLVLWMGSGGSGYAHRRPGRCLHLYRVC